MVRKNLLAAVSVFFALAPSRANPQDQWPQADNEVTRYLEKLLVHAPHYFRGLTLFPLELRGSEDETDYATLEEAFRLGLVVVEDSGSINRVIMRNVSGRWVFAMSGEVVVGGKQNRMIRDDVLLPPHSGQIVVPTYCVEKGRWAGGAKFSAGRTLSNYALRQQALAGASQAKVWGQVAAEQRRFHIQTPTQDYDRLAQSPAVRAKLDDYAREFRRIWRPRMVGFVVAQGRNIVAADAFCNERLFAKLRRKLLDSYAFDCVGRLERIRPNLTQEDARRFMARIYAARFTRTEPPGAGTRLDFRGRGVEGMAISRRGVVHLHATPGYHILPVPRPPVPIPPPRPLPEPRQR